MADQSLSARTELAKLREDIARLDRKLTRGLAAERRWMLLQTAIILVTLAHGFKWL